MPESNTQHLNGTLKQTVMLTAYRTLGCILLPVLPIALYIRGKKQVGYRQRMLERFGFAKCTSCLLYTSPSPRDDISSRMPSSA